MQYYIDWLGKSWSLLQLYPGQIHKLAAFYLCKVKTTPLAQRALPAKAENVPISKKKKEYNVLATEKTLICRFPILKVKFCIKQTLAQLVPQLSSLILELTINLSHCWLKMEWGVIARCKGSRNEI